MNTIVTKTGDKGMTGLFGGARVPKHSPRIEAYGTVDELNAALGVAIASFGLSDAIRDELTYIQHDLFRVGGDLATPLDRQSKQDRMNPDHVYVLEKSIDRLEKTLPQQKSFILPGGSPSAAHIHLARTICRRAERRVSALMVAEVINPSVQIYLNRLSDYLFLLARKANADAKVWDTEVKY